MEITAEFTYNHFGDIIRARKMIDAAKAAGATCVKFEVRNNASYFRNNPEIKKRKSRFEFSIKQMEAFVDYCRRVKIQWFASVHDLHSLKLVIELKPKYIKVASREAQCLPFLKEIVAVNKKERPIIVSTGAMKMQEIKSIYNLLKKEDLILVHTNCIYPCPPQLLNINRIIEFKKIFNCRIGYSGHEEGIIPSLYATTLGIDYLERHFTLEEKNKKVAKGKQHFKDDLCSLSPSWFKEMTEAINLILKLKSQKHSNKISVDELLRLNTYGKLIWSGEDVFLK